MGRRRGGRRMSASIPKNRTQEIRVRQREYEGRRFVDVRVHYPGDDGELRPTRQGVTVALDRADALADAIRAVAAQDQPDDD